MFLLLIASLFMREVDDYVNAMTIDEANSTIKKVLKINKAGLCLVPLQLYALKQCSGIPRDNPSLIVGDFDGNGSDDICAYMKEYGLQYDRKQKHFFIITHLVVFLKSGDNKWIVREINKAIHLLPFEIKETGLLEYITIMKKEDVDKKRSFQYGAEMEKKIVRFVTNGNSSLFITLNMCGRATFVYVWDAIKKEFFRVCIDDG